MTKAVQIRMDEKLKKQAENVLEDLGLDMPSAVRIFLKKVVITKSIPFHLKTAGLTENGFTPEFEEEILRASMEDEEIGPFKSAKQAIRALHK